MPKFMRSPPAIVAIVAILAVQITPGAHAQDRVVSVGGDLTEIIYALGAGERIVATDSTSVYPEAAGQTPKVGYLRRLSAEGVLSVEPDLVLVSGAARPREAVAQIRAAGVRMIEMEPDYTIGGVLEKTRIVAETLGLEARGRTFAAEIERAWADAQRAMDALDISPSVLFFAATPDGAPRAAGADTAADGVIRLIGGRNVFADHSGYKSLSLEAAVAADPDIILIMTHHADRVGGAEAVYAHPALSLTTAAKERRIFFVDQLSVMQFGPRMPAAIASLVADIAASQAAHDDS